MNFGTKKTLGSVLAALTTLAVVGCGGSNPSSQTTATVGAAGGTLRAGSSALTIPAGAVASPVAVTVREVEAHHPGRAVRVEVELGGSLAAPAQLSVQVDDRNGRVKMLSDDGAGEHLAEVELEDRGHHAYKTSMSQSGAVEVEVEHLRACAAACAASEECDDGVCKPHVEDAVGAVCSAVCASGQECDDGVCKAHGGGAAGGDPSVVPGGASCSAGCATGLECDNGVCKPHGGGK